MMRCSYASCCRFFPFGWSNATVDTITWVLPDVPRLYAKVIGLMQSSGGELNFNDALIALACRERDISAIASFDADFDQVSWLHRLATPADLTAF